MKHPYQHIKIGDVLVLLPGSGLDSYIWPVLHGVLKAYSSAKEGLELGHHSPDRFRETKSHTFAIYKEKQKVTLYRRWYSQILSTAASVKTPKLMALTKQNFECVNRTFESTNNKRLILKLINAE